MLASSPTRRSGFARHWPATGRETAEQNAEENGGDEQDELPKAEDGTAMGRAAAETGEPLANGEQRSAADATGTGFWVGWHLEAGSEQRLRHPRLKPLAQRGNVNRPCVDEGETWVALPP
ncbi:hypothetical protein MEX01_52860 [Methylorubrum extorquens]|nr:hypothetical protein MEX01_52860 [Methylorubrum extorquens]